MPTNLTQCLIISGNTSRTPAFLPPLLYKHMLKGNLILDKGILVETCIVNILLGGTTSLAFPFEDTV